MRRHLFMCPDFSNVITADSPQIPSCDAAHAGDHKNTHAGLSFMERGNEILLCIFPPNAHEKATPISFQNTPDIRWSPDGPRPVLPMFSERDAHAEVSVTATPWLPGELLGSTPFGTTDRGHLLRSVWGSFSPFSLYFRGCRPWCC